MRAKQLAGRLTARVWVIDKILPSMRTGIILDHPDVGRRVVIGTKFNSVVTGG